MTYREIVYSILDLLKLSSDDSYYTQDHILFIASKLRSAVLKQTYSNIKKEIPESNYQTICLDLEEAEAIEGDTCGELYLRSVQKIPTALPIGTTSVYPVDYYQGNITYISRERMKYVGHNKWLKNIIYASLGPDQHLYMKSVNPQFLYMEKARMTGVFEDAEAAAELSCDGGDKTCDILDKDFPMEEGLVSSVIEMAYKLLTGSIYKPADSTNNASDDLSEIATYLRQNLKSPMQKQIEG